MDSSLTLLSARIQFLEGQIALVHIPLQLYPNFLQPILQLLLLGGPKDDVQNGINGANGIHGSNDLGAHVSAPSIPVQPFVNISITPVECSIACPRELLKQFVQPIRDSLDPASRHQISITNDDFVVIQVGGEGLDAGQRVLELTRPLAMAGISIFFITTYFSDYIIVPARSRAQVVHALKDRGFTFETPDEGHIPHFHHRTTSSGSSLELAQPSTPPPTTISELESRTFATLKRRNVVPSVDRSIRLVQCASSKDPACRDTNMSRNGTSSAAYAEAKLNMGLIKCLISRPSFLSVTLTDTEPASILLEKRLLHLFDPVDVLLGSKEDVLIPITLDLQELPLESTGIVCGVAGRLVGGRAIGPGPAVEMSYLSTARAGSVMVAEDELERALDTLRIMEESGIH